MRLAVAYFVGISVIVGWSLREGAVASQRVTPLAKPVAAKREMAVAPSPATAATGRTRSGAHCSGCGVVESVRRIDTYVEIMEACLAGEGAGPFGRGYGNAESRHGDVESLADIAAASVVGKRGAKRFAVTTRHQIVVRFQDGSRQVLNETTPRALHEGERVIVIAGIGGTSG